MRAGAMGLSLLLAPSVAGAQANKQACLDAYEANQQLRKEGKLVEARSELLVCVQQTCPDFVRPDCEKWLGEVERQLPTVVFAAKEAGRDITDVRVFVDGVEVAGGIDGRAISINPGPHQLRFEHTGAEPKTMDVVIAQAMKDRVITVSFGADPAAPVPGTGPAPNPGPDRPADRGQPVAAYILGGLSLAAFASFAAFGVVGKNEADELNARCEMEGEVCTEDEIDSARTKLIVADVSLGVGIGLFAVGLGLFIYHFASEPDTDATAVRVDFGPTQGGAAGMVTVPF